MALRGQPHRLYRAFLLAFNVLLMVIAGSVASVGLFAFSERRRPGATYFSTLVMRLSVNLELAAVVGGGAVFSAAVLGFLGALRENLAALRLYALAMTGVAFVAFVGTAAITLTPFLANNVFHRYLQPDLVRYYRHSADWDDLVDHMQHSFQCCGIGPLAYQDWDRNGRYRCAPGNPSHERCSVPESCCRVRSAGCGRNVLSKSWDEAKKQIYGDSCLDSVLSSVRRNVVVIGGVALLASIGLLLVVATTRDFMKGIRAASQPPHSDKPRKVSSYLDPTEASSSSYAQASQHQPSLVPPPPYSCPAYYYQPQ
ncbi:tetraspanin-33-like [Dermacentor variabilis]|uniref:tetraspanin-33-like n=1 Tax=Dermacentor variabilis TaxID=34621 RepID=UPI003F5C0E44